jgi:hypothetical protein
MIRPLAWMNGIAFLAIGLGFTLFTKRAAQGLGIIFTSPVGTGDFRAVYGGVQIAVGAGIIFLCSRNLYKEAIVIGLMIAGGLAGVRILGIVVDRSALTVQWALLAPELFGVVLNAAALFRLSSASRASSGTQASIH